MHLQIHHSWFGFDNLTEVVSDLKVLEIKVRSCARCPLHKTRTQAVFARGPVTARIMIVGEAPGSEEDKSGLPFVGRAGQLLDSVLQSVGIKSVFITNMVKCRPPNNRKPEIDEISACSPHLEEQIELIKPKVIVALGATAVQGLTGRTDGITRFRGTWMSYKKIPLMPTLHPAYVLRNMSAKIDLESDLRVAKSKSEL